MVGVVVVVKVIVIPITVYLRAMPIYTYISAYAYF